MIKCMFRFLVSFVLVPIPYKYILHIVLFKSINRAQHYNLTIYIITIIVYYMYIIYNIRFHRYIQ